jgi:hypothetical protein
MNVATIHTVGPGDIIGEHGQHAVNVPRVKAIVDALEEFDITIHWFSPWHGARVASEAIALLRGNREVLRGFTDEEAGLLIALLR